MPEWGNLDILKACGASDPGSNPGSGVPIKVIIRVWDTILRPAHIEQIMPYASAE